MHFVSFPLDSISGIRSCFCSKGIKDRMVSPWGTVVFPVYKHSWPVLPVNLFGSLFALHLRQRGDVQWLFYCSLSGANHLSEPIWNDHPHRWNSIRVYKPCYLWRSREKIFSEVTVRGSSLIPIWFWAAGKRALKGKDQIAWAHLHSYPGNWV